jgi:hypothetical protein
MPNVHPGGSHGVLRAHHNRLQAGFLDEVAGVPEALFVANEHFGARILQAVLEFRVLPPTVQGHRNGTDGRDADEGNAPLRVIAHANRDAITLFDAQGRHQLRGEGGSGVPHLAEGEALVVEDKEGFVLQTQNEDK